MKEFFCLECKSIPKDEDILEIRDNTITFKHAGCGGKVIIIDKGAL